MNLPNILTLSRIPMLAVIIVLLYQQWTGAATLAFVLFIVAGITDWLDGYIARKLNMISDFGKLMDAITDKILMIGMFIALLVVGILPEWTLILVVLTILREILITALRFIAARKGTVLASEASGKLKTVTQIVAISVLLLVPALRSDVHRVTGWNMEFTASIFYSIGIVLFTIAAVMTIYSGISYMIKYRLVFIKS